MPTYDYQCEKCGRYEVSQRITDEALSVCPHCGESTKRLISLGAGIIFKGSGFHTTDYRNDSYKRRASEDKAPAAEKTPSAEAGKEKKAEPAAKDKKAEPASKAS